MGSASVAQQGQSARLRSGRSWVRIPLDAPDRHVAQIVGQVLHGPTVCGYSRIRDFQSRGSGSIPDRATIFHLISTAHDR